MYCHAYGTILRTNMPSQALTPALPSADALTIHVDRVPALPALGLAAGSRPLQGRMVQVFEKPPDIVMQVDDLMSVVYEQTNRRVHCLAVAHAPDPLIDYWLLRQFIPVARFLWNDAEVLHAGAVKIGENTAAFLAPAYTGKSTLVAEFIARGHKLVSDDHLLVRDTRDDPSTAVQALSSIPFYRDYRTFESLGRHTTQYDPAASRLRVMYVLKIAHPEAPVSIAALSDAEAAMELLRQAPFNRAVFGYPVSGQSVREHFKFIASLPRKVAVRRLDVPRSLDRVPEVCARVVSDFQEFCAADRAAA